MELKYYKLWELTAQKTSSNRTFMELKSEQNKEQRRTVHCSNRTFMELK